MGLQESIIFTLEIVGTIAFAASGAMVGVRKSMDIFGVCVLGVLTAVGGGMTRDIIVGVIPPAVFQRPVYVAVAAVTSCLFFAGMYFGKISAQEKSHGIYEKIMLAMDTAGLGIFTVVGVSTGIRQGYGDNLFLLVFLGTITGVGGGLMRDIMSGVPPYIFVRHIYACASIAGAVACAFLSQKTDLVTAMAAGMAVVIVMRVLAAYYRWNLPRLKEKE